MLNRKIYASWNAMKRGRNTRCTEWDNFHVFESWFESNSVEDKIMTCRFFDSSETHYTPNNIVFVSPALLRIMKRDYSNTDENHVPRGIRKTAAGSYVSSESINGIVMTITHSTLEEARASSEKHFKRRVFELLEDETDERVIDYANTVVAKLITRAVPREPKAAPNKPKAPVQQFWPWSILSCKWVS